MTNAELITALRCEKDCDDCAYHTDNAWSRCDEWGMRCDAADALEADEQRIKELESQAAFFDAEKLNYQENIEYRDERIKELEAQNELKDGTITAMATDIGKLQAQLPKEGEWIWENYCWHCSVCGENPTRGMGYVQGRNELFRVCPNCGARMKTVTECHILNGKEKGEQE